METAEKKNDNILIWTSGELEGLRVDFDRQTLSYRDNQPQILQNQTIRTLRFLYDHSSDYVTPQSYNAVDEFNSAQLSKVISQIKSSIISAMSLDPGDKERCNEVFSEMIARQKIRNSMSYKFLTDGLLPEVSDTDAYRAPGPRVIAPSEASPADKVPAEEISEEGNLKSYISQNWFPLFLFALLGILSYLVCSGNDVDIVDVFTFFVELPPIKLLLFIVGMSIFPVFAGIFIDSPLAMLRYKGKGSDMTREDIIKYKEGVFDITTDHIRLFALCNLSGALGVASILNYSNSLEGFRSFLEGKDLSVASLVILTVCAFVALYNNYCLQTEETAGKVRKNYLLSRVHAFTNTVWLTLSMSLAAFVILMMIWFTVVTRGEDITRFNPALCIMILATYAFLWFPADSPLASKLESVSNKNFITGAPVLSLSFALYMVFFFERTAPFFISAGLVILMTAAWVFYLKFHKKKEIVTLSRSFFVIISAAVIILLLFMVST